MRLLIGDKASAMLLSEYTSLVREVALNPALLEGRREAMAMARMRAEILRRMTGIMP